jgi:SAM-dependent methyltransferase
MQAVLRSLRRNALVLRKSPEETALHYRARLLFELRRRSSQLLSKFNPFDETYRLERLVGPAGIWRQLQQYQFNALTAAGLKPHHSVIDIGCGPLTVGVPLIDYLDRGNYVGLDLLPEPLVEAYRRIAQQGLAHKNPRLVCSSTFGKRELEGRTFDFIWMSQLSYHLDDLQLVLLFEQARAMMNSSSVLLLDVIDPHLELERDDRWRGFSYHLRPVEIYESLAQEFSLSVRRRGQLIDYGYPDKINLSRNSLLEFRNDDSPPLQPQLDDAAGMTRDASPQRRDAALVL